jgi:uncharacterized membrane protein
VVRGGQDAATTAESKPGGGVLAQTAQEVEALEAEQRERESLQERLANAVTTATGSMTFVVINLVWFAAWIIVNLPGMPLRFDPFPSPLLTMLVSLEAIILAVLVLISENAQSRRAEHRARIDMQVNVLAEREVTRLVELVTEIHEKLGLTPPPRDERNEMATPTPLKEVASSLDAVSEDEHA